MTLNRTGMFSKSGGDSPLHPNMNEESLSEDQQTIHEYRTRKKRTIKKMDLITSNMLKMMKARGGFNPPMDFKKSNMKYLPKELQNLEKFKTQIDKMLKQYEKASTTSKRSKKASKMKE